MTEKHNPPTWRPLCLHDLQDWLCPIPHCCHKAVAPSVRAPMLHLMRCYELRYHPPGGNTQHYNRQGPRPKNWFFRRGCSGSRSPTRWPHKRQGPFTPPLSFRVHPSSPCRDVREKKPDTCLCLDLFMLLHFFLTPPCYIGVIAWIMFPSLPVNSNQNTCTEEWLQT